jgi:hypothetical protein
LFSEQFVILKNKFVIPKMRAIFKSVWVRKLIGKLGVPYNRRLGVRGSSHPLFYDADLSLPTADSNAFRNQSGLPCFESRIAELICFASGGVTRTANNSPLAFCFPMAGRPAFFFIIIVNKYIGAILISVNNYCKIKIVIANILKAAQKCSMGLRSGEQAGKKNDWHPALHRAEGDDLNSSTFVRIYRPAGEGV